MGGAFWRWLEVSGWKIGRSIGGFGAGWRGRWWVVWCGWRWLEMDVGARRWELVVEVRCCDEMEPVQACRGGGFRGVIGCLGEWGRGVHILGSWAAGLASSPPASTNSCSFSWKSYRLIVTRGKWHHARHNARIIEVIISFKHHTPAN